MEITSTYVGRRSRPYTIELTSRRTMNFAAGLLDDNPHYFDDEHEGGIVAHPMLAVALSWHMVAERAQFWDAEDFPPDIAARQVHYTEAIEWHRPMRPGDTLTLQAEVVAVIPHRAGAHMVVRYEATRDGEPVFTEHSGAILREVKCTDDGKGKDSVPHFDRFPKPDEPLWEKTLHVGPLAAHLYDGAGEIHNPIHTSVAFARGVGLPDIILHGTATLGYAVREILEREGAGDPERLAGLRCNFTGMVLLDTDINIQVLGKEEKDSRIDYHFLVLNQDGQRAIRNACVSLHA